MKNRIIGLFCFMAVHLAASAQTHVQLNLNVKHKLGDVTEFNRPKFINFHATINENYWDSANKIADLRDDLIRKYDVYVGRETGMIKTVLRNVKEDPERPGFADPDDLARLCSQNKKRYVQNTKVHPYEKYSNLILCNQFSPFYPDGTKTLKGWALSQKDTEDEPFGTASGEFYGRYIKEYFGEGGESGEPKPGFCEVINEPLWDIYDKPKAPKSSITKLFEFHSTIAAQVKKFNPDMKVGGYCTAFPDFELQNFGRWNARWKQFIDIAGKDMDFFTIHLYDFPCKDGKQMYRKGSNMEATMDMIEQYSMIKLGEVKPLMISEYSAQTHDYNRKPWSPYRDWLRLKSTNSMLMQFMERTDNICYAMPFAMLKAEWGYNPKTGLAHTARMLRRENEPESFTGEYVYSELIKFYQLWKDVKGTRVETNCDNPDIMCDAYVDGKNVYFIINNLDFKPVDLNLSVNGTSKDAKSIEVRHLYLKGGKDGVPMLDVYDAKSLDHFTLETEATCVICYNFDRKVKINETMEEVKYYATDYLKEIAAGKELVFNINNVKKTEYGEAVIRLGLGRNHGLSLLPELLVNGKKVDIPDNFRGDVQKDRASFFGVIEVPVDYSILKGNNTISLKFPDNGGHVSTVTMQIFNFSNNIRGI